MTDIPEIWNLSALCRCCHSDGYFKSLQGSYVFENEIEIYSEMLRETLNVEIKVPPVDASYTICDACILRLRDAYQFKTQVSLCERKFEEYCKNELAGNIEANVSIKSETEFGLFDDDDNQPPGDVSPNYEIEIKCDDVFTKKEEIDAEMQVQVKSEEDNKATIEIQKEKVIKKDTKTDIKKRAGRKKPKSEPQTKYDLSLEVQVKTEAGISYSCKVCGGYYQDQKSLKKHIESTHMEAKYKCLYCDERFDSVSKRNEHLKTHVDRAMKCSFCDKVFYSNTALKSHEKTHSRSKEFKCDLCSKEFAYKNTLRLHLRGHYGTKKTCMCHLCGRGFNDNANLNSHIRTVHEKQRPFLCKLCPQSFTANKHLKVHMMKHRGEQPFACDQCPRKFYCVSSLNAHKLVHLDGVTKYSCKVCRRRFVEKVLFIRHLRKAHVGQRPFKCTICDKDFTCKYSMKRHILQHNGIKPFACECGAKFAQKGSLKKHKERKHVNPKENEKCDNPSEKCEICNKLVSNLQKHMACHNNKRYSCEYCDKSYSENNTLTRHKKVVHFGIKPHVCEYCDKKYCKINSLKNHQLKVHKIVSKIETDEDFGSAVAKFSIKNKKGKIKSEGVEVIQTFT